MNYSNIDSLTTESVKRQSFDSESLNDWDNTFMCMNRPILLNNDFNDPEYMMENNIKN